jgi:hypothetical protein
MNHDEDHDPLVEGLGPGPLRFDVPRPPAGLRERLLERTSAVVRSRARWRRIRIACALVLVYAAGIATAVPLLLDRSGPAERAASEPEPRPAAPALLDPDEVRRSVADAPPAERARLLRLAGDLFLEGRGDASAALECYRQVLELSPVLASRSEPGDSWLLIALKQSTRIEEGAVQ